jgi:hypothetical protein
MDKSLEEKEVSHPLHWGRGRFAFLAQQEQIKSMLAVGHTQLEIYKALQVHLNGLCYSQFSHLIRKNITARSKPAAPPATKITTPPKYESQKNLSASKPAFRSFQPGPTLPDINDLF